MNIHQSTKNRELPGISRIWFIRNRKEALFRISILVLIAALACLCNNLFFTGTRSVPEDYRVESLKSIYPSAFAEAKKWKKDAYLNGASFFVNPQNDTHPLWASFGFERLESNEWLLIEYSQQNNKTELTKTEKGVHPLDIERPGIEIDKIKSDSYEAFMLMYDAEGERLSQKYPDLIYPIILYLNHHPKENVEWVASWQTTNGVSWRIKMDAYTNQNIRVDISE